MSELAETLEAHGLEHLDEDTEFVTLVTGKVNGGKPYYAYVLIKPSQYLAFKEAEKNGNFNVTDYGKVVSHGEGEEPPTEVQNEMKEKYGANPEFEEKLKAVFDLLVSE